MHIPINHQDAPWKLKGEGFILVYNFDKDWVMEHGFLTEEQQRNFKGGFGFVMLVDYRSSPIGPYYELLFIPGKFEGSNRYSITKIYVDTKSSKINGRSNWGIPKETQPFIWQSRGKTTSIGVGEESDPVLFCKISHRGISFPVTTKILPIKLIQQLEDKTFLTDPAGTGWAKLANVESIKVNSIHFPDISKQKALFAFRVAPFTMHFPTPIITQSR
jgi:hypothetical protein